MNTNPMLILGIDAADRHLVRGWADDGSLPNFARLFATSAHGDSRNATGMVAGTVWPTFYTGVLPGRTGRFRGTTQFVTGTYEHADIDFDRHGFPAFWTRLSEAGLSSTVVDAPYAFLSDAPGVTQIVDWCSHSAWKDGVTSSTPPALAADTRHRYGRDPVGKCDFARVDTIDDLRRFRDGLIERVGMRVAQTRDLLAEQPGDVFLQVFSECHCAGHQLWHLHDPDHPLHDPALVAALGGDPLKAVYQAVDSAVGELLDAIPADGSALVFCSHGIGPAYSGTHLLDEILLQLEGRNSPRKRQGVAQAMVATWTRLPQAVRTALTPLQKALWPKLKANLVQPGKSGRKYFEIIVNDASAGVRINLKGREPRGVVEPGAEYDAICAMLSRELLEIANPDTGRPLISRVLKASDVYRGDRVAQLPDLLVLWDRSGPIHRASGASIGEISSKFVFANHRTGDHTEDDGLFFFVGPGFPARELEQVSVADLAPTIAALQGVTMPETDGEPIVEICQARAKAAGPSGRHKAGSMDRVRVIYVGGWGRSGSSMLANVLGSHPEAASIGELRYLWDRGMLDQRRCGCGSNVPDCDFWTQCVERAGISTDDEVAREQTRTVGSRAILRQMLALITGRLENYRNKRVEPLDRLTRLYRSAADVAGARVLVDASKSPPYAINLLDEGQFELYFLHLVRDPRAVAYSWARKRASKDAPGDYLPRYSVLRCVLYWYIFNLLGLFFRGRRGVSYRLVRYEDLASNPRATIEEILRDNGLPCDGLDWQNSQTVHVSPQHSVSGNPSRFDTGVVRIRRDEEWRGAMSGPRRWLVTLFCAPLLPIFGYTLNPRPLPARSDLPEAVDAER